MNDREDQNYEENERSIKPTGVYLRRLEQRYMEDQKEIEEMNQIQQPTWLVNILFCYEGETHTGNDNKRKQHLQHKGKHSNNKEVYTDGSKSTARKVDFAAVFADIRRRGVLKKETSIHTPEITAIKIAMREI